MSEENREVVELRLNDYLQPRGKYPYESLAPKMEQLKNEGKHVKLISVPGSLMGNNWSPYEIDPNDTPENKKTLEEMNLWLWSDCSGDVYKSAADLLNMKNGKSVLTE